MYTDEDDDGYKKYEVDMWIWIGSQIIIIVIAAFLCYSHDREKKKFKKQLYDFSLVSEQDVETVNKSQVLPDNRKPLINSDYGKQKN